MDVEDLLPQPVTYEQRRDAFFLELAKLTEKYDIVLSGCGCCAAVLDGKENSYKCDRCLSYDYGKYTTDTF